MHDQTPDHMDLFAKWLDAKSIGQLDIASLRAAYNLTNYNLRRYGNELAEDLRQAMEYRAVELLRDVDSVIDLLDLLPLLPTCTSTPLEHKVKMFLKLERRPEVLSLLYDMTSEWPEVRTLVVERIRKLISNMTFGRIHERFECFIQIRGAVDEARAGGHFFCTMLALALANRAISVNEIMIALDAARQIPDMPHLARFAEASLAGAIRGPYNGEPKS